MRYAQGGGLADERRVFREQLRLQVAEWFRQGDENTVIAYDLRVSVRSVQRWRKAWSQGGSPVWANASAGCVTRRDDGGARRARLAEIITDLARQLPL